MIQTVSKKCIWYSQNLFHCISEMVYFYISECISQISRCVFLRYLNVYFLIGAEDLSQKTPLCLTFSTTSETNQSHQGYFWNFSVFFFYTVELWLLWWYSSRIKVDFEKLTSCLLFCIYTNVKKIWNRIELFVWRKIELGGV